MKCFVPERFALIRLLREDRYTKTFLANDHLLDLENVVVRIISKDCVNGDYDRLIEHFSWNIGVHHRQFATVFDSGFTKQQHLYVVREYLPPSELPSSEIFTTVKSLISAVDFLAGHGCVHGNIKPSNIFVSQESVKLTDAKVPGAGLRDDAESVHFVAPEIWGSGHVTHETDLYSLGAVFNFVLTGRHLFEDVDLSRLRAKYATASPRHAPYLSPISQSISGSVLELLSRNPIARVNAFERLKRAVASDRTVPNRAA